MTDTIPDHVGREAGALDQLSAAFTRLEGWPSALRETGLINVGPLASDIATIMEAYRTGQLVLVDDEAVERVAVRLWRADAERAAPNVARSRDAEAFKNESTVTREKWIGLASAALAALQVKP